MAETPSSLRNNPMGTVLLKFFIALLFSSPYNDWGRGSISEESYFDSQ